MIVLHEHLSKTREILDKHTFQNDREFQRLLKSLFKSLEALEEQQKAHLQYRREFARDMVEQVKLNAINVGPLQEPLQTVPYLMGEKRIREQETQQNTSKKKKRKQK